MPGLRNPQLTYHYEKSCLKKLFRETSNPVTSRSPRSTKRKTDTQVLTHKYLTSDRIAYELVGLN